MQTTILACPECGYPTLPQAPGVCPECGFPAELFAAAVPKRPSKFTKAFGAIASRGFPALRQLASFLARLTYLLVARWQLSQARRHAKSTPRDNASVTHWQEEVDSARRDIRQMFRKSKWLVACGGAALCLILGIFFIRGFTSSTSSTPTPQAVNQPLTLPPATLRASQSTFPVLSVIEQNGQWEGRWQQVSLVFERSQDRKVPLRIAVEEDTAAGAGSVIRASLWQSAIVAALLRNDTLQGVQATFTLSGGTDGASAGGVCCLALLSALDQRPLPTDFAFTGSILPDGTIGRVSGLPQKISAAKQAGVQRVLVPADCRYELDRTTGQSVDIKQRCLELGLEYVPVTSIEQAYALVHRLSSSAPEVTDKHLAAFSEQEEAILIAEVNRLAQEADRYLAQLSDAERSRLEALLSPEVMKLRSEIDRSLTAGRVAAAYQVAVEWYCLPTALANAKQHFLAETNGEELLERLDEQLEGSRQQIPLPEDVASQLNGAMLLLGAQMLFPCEFRPSVSFRLGQLQSDLENYHEKLSNVAQDSLPEGQSRDMLLRQAAINRKFAGWLTCESARSTVKQRLELAKVLSSAGSVVPGVSPQRVQEANLLCEQALDASRKVYWESVLVPNSEGVDPVKTFLVFKQIDPLVLRILVAHEDVVHLREAIKVQSTARSDALPLLSAQCQLKEMAYFWAATVRWAELEPILGDDKIVLDHGQRELLNQLIERARNKALASIIACRRQGIPCPGVVAAYQQALSLDADRKTDGVEVLASYWLASLEGQLLTLTHTAN
jgi:hypothetical protein